MLPRSHSKALDGLKRLVDRKRLTRIVYMHADHFEPWRRGITQRNADNLVAFGEAVAKTAFSRKLSLFYKPWVAYAFAKDPGAAPHIEGEPIVFRPHTDAEADIARRALRELLRTGEHEINLHIHHEGFTSSGVRRNAAIAGWLAANSGPAADAKRFELYLQLSLAAARDDTGLALERWAFVHGAWALNGSDHSICRIPSEIGILQRNGCFGDFTFPAGRAHVNPKIKHPFTCLPVVCDRAYDRPEAKPRIVVPASGAFVPGHFFIWSSAIGAGHCSIDYHDPEILRNLADSTRAAFRLIAASVHFDGTVYVKTHSHSMAGEYWESVRKAVAPHLHANVRSVLSQIAEFAAKLGLALEFATASTVVDEFVRKSAPDYAARAPTPQARRRPEILISRSWKSRIRVRRALVLD